MLLLVIIIYIYFIDMDSDGSQFYYPDEMMTNEEKKNIYIYQCEKCQRCKTTF